MAKLTDLIAIVDTREQLPFDLKLSDGTILTQVRKGLKTGDYSVQGLEEIVAIERKSMDDLAGCIGKHRARFEDCIDRLAKFPMKAIVVEGSWSTLELGFYRSRVHPNAAIGSCLSWISRGIPMLFLGNPVRASEYTARLLVHAYKRYVLEPGALDETA